MHRFFASTKNTRPVLPGSLRYIRSDVPLQVTEEEKQWLAGHNITTVVDLRTERERAAKPCPLEQDGRFCCRHLPVTGGDALPESPAWVAQSYINMADDRMEGILKTITEAESNVLFFCTAGKDRTGVVAALLQRRAGCSEEYILQDYLLSGRNLAADLEQYARSNPGVDLAVITPQHETMERFLRAVTL